MVETLESMLRRHEGLRTQAYDDATGRTIGPGSTLVGIPTIGVGRNLLRPGISTDEALELLRADIVRVEEGLDDIFPWWRGLPEGRDVVVANMVFNLGLHGFASFKRAIAAMRARDFHTAALEMQDSRWFGQVGPRAKELCNIMRVGSNAVSL